MVTLGGVVAERRAGVGEGFWDDGYVLFLDLGAGYMDVFTW